MKKVEKHMQRKLVLQR